LPLHCKRVNQPLEQNVENKLSSNKGVQLIFRCPERGRLGGPGCSFLFIKKSGGLCSAFLVTSRVITCFTFSLHILSLQAFSYRRIRIRPSISPPSGENIFLWISFTFSLRILSLQAFSYRHIRIRHTYSSPPPRKDCIS